RRKIRDAFVPPKPKEFDSAVSTSRLRIWWGTRSIGVSTDGLSRLIVGGTTRSRIARIENIASTAPAAPSKWPIHDLVEDIEIWPADLPTSFCTAPSSISSPNGVEVPWALMYSISLAEMPARRIAAPIQRSAPSASGARAALWEGHTDRP